MEQWRVRTRDILTNACQSFLAETSGWVSVKEISDATSFRPDAVKKSLKALADADLVELSGDKARGKLTGKVIQFLPLTPATVPMRVALRNYWDKWISGSKRVAVKRQIVRLSKASLDQYRQHLEKAVELSAVYGNPSEDRHSSAVYFVDGSIFRIFPKE
jgi:DNA-binding transcriptional ArsR family regulator